MISPQQTLGSPQLGAHIHQCLSFFVPLFFQYLFGQQQGCSLDDKVFPLRLGNVLVDDGQLLLQRGNDEVLATIVFDGRRKVFRSLLRVCTGVLFALNIAPSHCLCVGGGCIGFGLPHLGQVFYRLPLDLLQTGAEALAFFVEL
ncbi:hypothetical protein D3C84_867130 [compost metagenome]